MVKENKSVQDLGRKKKEKKGKKRKKAHRSPKWVGRDRRVARNLQWGAVWGVLGQSPMGVWGRSLQPPKAGSLGAKPPAAGGTGVWGRSSQRSKILQFFAKITSF